MTKYQSHRDRRIRVGSIVQINETVGSPCWVGCLLIVTELKAWGVQGCIAVPGNLTEPPGLAYLRPKWEAIEWVGHAVLTPSGEEEQEP